MHFIAAHEQLNSLMQITQKTISQRSPMPILSCVHFECKNNYLFLSSTDLEYGIRCSMPITSIVDGSAAIPAKYLTGIFAKLPDIDIHIKGNIANNTTTLIYGDSEIVLNGYPAEEFPLFPSFPEEPSFAVQQGQFKNLIKKVIFAVSSEDQRPIFTGINILVSPDGVITMLATDIRRLAYAKDKLINPPKEPINIIVPSKAMQELYKILDNTEDTFNIYIADNKVFFVMDNICLMSRLIAGTFPDYKLIIPEKYVCETKASVNSLLEAAERISMLVDSKRNVFSISLKPNNMVIFFFTETGRIREEVSADLQGEPIDIGYNVRFFIDALKSIDDEEVLIKISGSNSQSLIMAPGEDNYFNVLVPATFQTSV